MHCLFFVFLNDDLLLLFDSMAMVGLDDGVLFKLMAADIAAAANWENDAALNCVLLVSVELLVIDEISMMSKKIFEVLDMIHSFF